MDIDATVPQPRSGRIPSGCACRPRLTVRQREVLDLLCEGRADKAISTRMRISFGTVTSHVGGILRHWGVPSRVHAVVSTCRQYSSGGPSMRLMSAGGETAYARKDNAISANAQRHLASHRH